MIKPNLWITGLPKAGTSTLFSNLQQHPSITGSRPKETFFLLDPKSILLNQKNNYWRNGPAGWREFYDNDSVINKYYLEATTHLFFQEESLRILKEFHTGSRFIIMLREPSERIYSSFIFTRDTLVRIPSDVTFSQYVSDLFAGRQLDYISNPVSKYVLSRELIYSQYFNYLRQWQSTFDRSEMFIGLFEEYVKNSKVFVQNVFRFLELDELEVAASHNNPSRVFKHRGLHKALLRTARLFPVGGSVKKVIKKSYLRVFSSAPKLAEEDRIAKARLRKYFASSNEALVRDFGIDISSWDE